MTCKECGESVEVRVIEETEQGYVWESKCKNNTCGYEDTGYEF